MVAEEGPVSGGSCASSKGSPSVSPSDCEAEVELASSEKLDVDQSSHESSHAPGLSKPESPRLSRWSFVSKLGVHRRGASLTRAPRPLAACALSRDALVPGPQGVSSSFAHFFRINSNYLQCAELVFFEKPLHFLLFNRFLE